MRKIVYAIFLLILVLSASAQDKKRVDRYGALGETWLSDRLQMHWQTHATQQYVDGEAYDHCGGDSAAVPTLQICGARSHATVYKRPSLDDLQPRQEDTRGMYLRNTSLPDQPYEWTPLSATGNIALSINKEVTGLARDAALLYGQTGDEHYARIAYNVLSTYMLGVLHTEMPIDLKHGHIQTIIGLQTFEVIHEETLPALCENYNLLHDYITLHEDSLQQVLPQGAITPFNSVHDAIEGAFKHWADVIEANGVPHNNWDFIQARFIYNVAHILQPDAAYADHKGREHYMAIVETGKSIRQWSLKAITEYGYDPENGIWCECPGYSQGVLNDLAEFTRLYREDYHRDLMAELPIIRKAALNNVEYLFPDSMIMAFGDTHPSRLNAEAYRKLGIDPATLHPHRMFYAPRTSWLIQRTGMAPKQSLAFALNGSDGNHMHANGISLELYGCGLRLGPDGGIGYSLYSGQDYHEYYSRFLAHNTVCVNGKSDYAVMQSNHPFTLVQQDTLPVQYSEVAFTEPETRAQQQRLVVMTDDYYIDVFRSRVPQPTTPLEGKGRGRDCATSGEPQYHDYFYHNLGQTMTLTEADGTPLALTPTNELAFAGGHLYAYSYIYDKKGTQTTADLSATYSINGDSILMTQWIRGGEDRLTVQALSPSTEGLSRLKGMPYDIRNTPTLTFVARQQGEAWTHPFVSVFQPSSQYRPATIDSVTFPEVKILDKKTESAVAVLVTLKNGERQLMVSTDNDKARVRVLGKTFRGRFNFNKKFNL